MNQSSAEGSATRNRRLHALQRQIERLDRCLVELENQSRRISHWRLLSFVLFLAGGAAVLLAWGLGPWLVFSLLLLSVFWATERRLPLVEESETHR